MTSLEFEILLETARTNWKEPNLPWGGIPDISSQDVQQAFSQITHPYGATAIRARYLSDTQAIYNLAEWARNLSWDLWPERKKLAGVRITFESLAMVGELAVLDFVNPQAVGQSQEQRAAICKVGKAAWKNYMALHRQILFDNLTTIESESLRTMVKFLRSD